MSRRTYQGMLAGVLAALALHGAAAEVAAQVYRLRVVSAECTPHGCRLVASVCTAVAIGRHNPGREIFLSAGHCVRGSVRSVSIEIGETWRPAVVLGISTRNGCDLAALGVSDADRDLRCVEVAGQPPAIGATVALESFPEGGALQRRTGRVVSHAYRDVDLVVNVPTRPGESGGAILDADGRLAGIISATGPLPAPNHTLATGVVGIRAFLCETFRAGVPHCGGTSPLTEKEIDDADVVALDGKVAGLVAEVERLRARLVELERTQIPVQVLSAEGRIIDERHVPLGQPIQLRLFPTTREATRAER